MRATELLSSTAEHTNVIPGRVFRIFTGRWTLAISISRKSAAAVRISQPTVRAYQVIIVQETERHFRRELKTRRTLSHRFNISCCFGRISTAIGLIFLIFFILIFFHLISCMPPDETIALSIFLPNFGKVIIMLRNKLTTYSVKDFSMVGLLDSVSQQVGLPFWICVYLWLFVLYFYMHDLLKCISCD